MGESSKRVMTSCADLRILFRAPAGPRRGFGHLVRCRSLARALGVRPLLALRGSTKVEEAALALGCDVVHGSANRLLRSLAPDVLVVDDPVTTDARRWMAAGRRAGCLVVSVHDLGLGCLDADLVIDGSVTMNARARRGTTLAGPEFALLDPALVDQDESRDPYSVLVALGGGPRAELAVDIAEAIVDAVPQATVRVAGGFMSTPAQVRQQITWVGPARSLHSEMARASVAVVAGVFRSTRRAHSAPRQSVLPLLPRSGRQWRHLLRVEPRKEPRVARFPRSVLPRSACRF